MVGNSRVVGRPDRPVCQCRYSLLRFRANLSARGTARDRAKERVCGERESKYSEIDPNERRRTGGSIEYVFLV